MATVAVKAHWSWLCDTFGCMVCRMPASIHHCLSGSIAHELGVSKSVSEKNNDWLTIPLCHNHHQGAQGIHTIGVLTWEEQFGSQLSFLDRVNGHITSFDLFERAGLQRRKP